MTNQEVAEILRNIANLYELNGRNTYRVRAYQKAADVVSNTADDLKETNRQGKLEDIPGVGKSIAEKIGDILTTGTTPVYEELKSQFPEGLMEIMAVPSIGPKTARLLYDTLGITSIEELEQAAKEHRISRETDLSPKTEQSILQGIHTMVSEIERLNLGIALPLAQELISRLKRSPMIERISEAGSLRRRKDTIGDIDIVAETTDIKGAIDVFAHLPNVLHVIQTGPSMSAVVVRYQDIVRRADLRLTDTEHYGAMLHHFTGGKLHNIKLRGIANSHGLTINEYGVHRLDTGETVTTGRTEKDIYGTLGLPWIPPELREDRGEIEAAMEGRLPDLVDEGNIKGDLHLHTNWSDGRNTIEEMAEAARRRGYEYIAICDHSVSLTIAKGLSRERLLQQIDEIRSLNRRLRGIRVLAGAEVDIKADGTLDFDQYILEKLDIVIASVHQRYRQNKDQMTRRIVNAIKSGYVDILAHPTGRLINKRPPYDVDMDKVFDAAVAHNVALEINCYPDRLDLNDIYARAAKDRGIMLSINTDAHNTGEYANIRYGLAMARRGWCEPSDILNALSLDDLMIRLYSRRTHLRAAA